MIKMVKTAFVAIFLFIIGVSGTIALLSIGVSGKVTLNWKVVHGKPR